MTTVVVFESGFHTIVAVRIATFAKSIRTILLTGTSEERAQSVRAVLAGERSFPSSLLVADDMVLRMSRSFGSSYSPTLMSKPRFVKLGEDCKVLQDCDMKSAESRCLSLSKSIIVDSFNTRLSITLDD